LCTRKQRIQNVKNPLKQIALWQPEHPRDPSSGGAGFPHPDLVENVQRSALIVVLPASGPALTPARLPPI